MAGTAAGGNYKRILQLLDKWPIKKGRPCLYLCDFLQQKVDTAYKAHKFDVDIKYWDNQFLILQRLTNNESATKYPRALTSSATGLTPEQCQQVILDEFIEEVHREEEQPLFYDRLLKFIGFGKKEQ